MITFSLQVLERIRTALKSGDTSQKKALSTLTQLAKSFQTSLLSGLCPSKKLTHLLRVKKQESLKSGSVLLTLKEQAGRLLSPLSLDLTIAQL